ncbi:MAG: hypothetical protein M1829_001336 [Trizodia sp. TS-e1964]|nr:MAG: hypothetical protein M1829_001336 [Trizodia sp. TS-e1964]
MHLSHILAPLLLTLFAGSAVASPALVKGADTEALGLKAPDVKAPVKAHGPRQQSDHRLLGQLDVRGENGDWYGCLTDVCAVTQDTKNCGSYIYAHLNNKMLLVTLSPTKSFYVEVEQRDYFSRGLHCIGAEPAGIDLTTTAFEYKSGEITPVYNGGSYLKCVQKHKIPTKYRAPRQ